MKPNQRGVLAAMAAGGEEAVQDPAEAGELDADGGEPADETAQQQYEYLLAAAKTALYGDPKQFQQTVLSVAKAPRPAVAAGEAIGRIMQLVVDKAEDDSGADVDHDAIEEAAMDMLELFYDDLLEAGIVNEADPVEEFAEEAYTAAYGTFTQGRVATGRMKEEDLTKNAGELQQMMAAGGQV